MSQFGDRVCPTDWWEVSSEALKYTEHLTKHKLHPSPTPKLLPSHLRVIHSEKVVASNLINDSKQRIRQCGEFSAIAIRSEYVATDRQRSREFTHSLQYARNVAPIQSILEEILERRELTCRERGDFERTYFSRHLTVSTKRSYPRKCIILSYFNIHKSLIGSVLL